MTRSFNVLRHLKVIVSAGKCVFVHGRTSLGRRHKTGLSERALTAALTLSASWSRYRLVKLVNLRDTGEVQGYKVRTGCEPGNTKKRLTPGCAASRLQILVAAPAYWPRAVVQSAGVGL